VIRRAVASKVYLLAVQEMGRLEFFFSTSMNQERRDGALLRLRYTDASRNVLLWPAERHRNARFSHHAAAASENRHSAGRTYRQRN